MQLPKRFFRMQNVTRGLPLTSLLGATRLNKLKICNFSHHKARCFLTTSL